MRIAKIGPDVRLSSEKGDICCDRQNGRGGRGGGIDRVGTFCVSYFMCNRDFSLIIR